MGCVHVQLDSVLICVHYCGLWSNEICVNGSVHKGGAQHVTFHCTSVVVLKL